VAPRIRFINPEALVKPPSYTQVVEVTGPGRTIYIAGQLGTDRDGNVVGAPGDFRAQALQVFGNLRAALAAVEADFADVIKLNSYLADIAHLPNPAGGARGLSQCSGAAGKHHHRGVKLRASGGAAGDRGGRGVAVASAGSGSPGKAVASIGATRTRRRSLHQAQAGARKTTVTSASTGNRITAAHTM